MIEFISRAYGSKEWEVIIKTDNEDHYKDAVLFARKLIGHGKTHPMTNADLIRGMSDEELARTFAQTGNCPPSSKYGHNCERCGKCWLDYLRQPVKDGDSE